MTIIYIHGVKVRSPNHGVELAKPFRRWLSPKLSVNGAAPGYDPVYWGDVAARFRWDLESRPKTALRQMGGDETFAGLGSLREASSRSLLDDSAPLATDDGPVLGAAPAATPAAAMPPLASVPRDRRADFLADLYLAVRPRRRSGEDPIADDPGLAALADAAAAVAADWDSLVANEPDEDARAARLVSAIEATLTDDKTLAMGGFADWMTNAGEALRRATIWPADAVSTVFAELRPTVNEFVAYFIGDVLAYLNERDTGNEPGEIQRRVLVALRRASARRKQTGEKIVVVTHSMGGQLFYDAVNYFAPADPSLVELESHVKQRVRELLARQSALKIQPVEPYGNPYNGEMLVAEKRGPQVGTGAPGGPPPIRVPPPSAGPALDKLLATRSSDLLKGFTTFSSSDIGPFRASAQGRAGFRGDLTDSGIMHEIFRHESVTDPWIDSLQILDAESEEPVPPQTVVLSEGRSQEVGKSLTAWVDVSVAPGAGKAVWISAGGQASEPSCAVVIARDLNFPVPVRLDIAFRVEEDSARWALESMSARLAPPQGRGSDIERIWQSLWEIQRLEALFDLGRAGVAAQDFVQLESALFTKGRSPLAAAIATTVLLRCGALEYLHDWPRNLANRFDWLPDGAVLWAETLLRRHDLDQARQLSARVRAERPARKSASQDDAAPVRQLAGEPAYKKARTFFVEIGRRGPPLLTTSLAIAARQLPFWASRSGNEECVRFGLLRA